MNYLLYNNLADGGRGKEDAEIILSELTPFYPELVAKSVLETSSLDLVKSLKKDDVLILVGGDGTLNHFINEVGDVEIKGKVYLYPSGTGNDFLNDVLEEQDQQTKLVSLNQFINNLPYIEVNGRVHRFINGIGYGIDGDCCVEAERMKKEGKQDINYSSITIGLLFGAYKPHTAKVTVDGETIVLPKAYLASAMNGRYYGGGMKIAPNQERGSGLLSSVIIHGRGKLGTFLMFPGLFKGAHAKNKKNVSIRTGKVIEVEFDSPCGLQIDGEVVEGVTSYKAWIK